VLADSDVGMLTRKGGLKIDGTVAFPQGEGRRDDHVAGSVGKASCGR